METNEVVARLESAATQLEQTLAWIEERQSALCGQVERISATVEQTRREEELAQKLIAAEREIAELKAAAERHAVARGDDAETVDALQTAAAPLKPAAPVRRTIPAATTAMLAKHGIGEGPVDVKVLDAALTGLSVEQRIAVKSQLLRAGAIENSL